MITPEARPPVIIDSQCSSINRFERSTEYVLPRIQVILYIYIYFYSPWYGKNMQMDNVSVNAAQQGRI